MKASKLLRRKRVWSHLQTETDKRACKQTENGLIITLNYPYNNSNKSWEDDNLFASSTDSERAKSSWKYAQQKKDFHLDKVMTDGCLSISASQKTLTVSKKRFFITENVAKELSANLQISAPISRHSWKYVLIKVAFNPLTAVLPQYQTTSFYDNAFIRVKA